MKKNRITNIQGITLIALVVTIVVLLILAGVTIQIVAGPNGIISMAQKATNDYKEKADQEQKDIQDLLKEWENNKNDNVENPNHVKLMIKSMTRVEDDILGILGAKEIFLEGELTIFSDEECQNLVRTVQLKNDKTYSTEELLPVGKYYINSSKTPAGYNAIKKVEVEVIDNSKDTVWTIYWTTGKLLPSSGEGTWYVGEKVHAPLDESKTVTIGVKSSYRGSEVNLYKIGDLGQLESMESKGEFDFELFGGPKIEWKKDSDYLSTEQIIYSYLLRDKCSGYSGVTNENGEITFNNLPQGLYIVGADPGVARLLELPAGDENGYIYEMGYDMTWGYEKPNEEPIEPETAKKYTAVVQLDESFGESTPENVTVDILRNGSVYDTITMPINNGKGQYTWENLDVSCGWRICVREDTNWKISNESIVRTYGTKIILKWFEEEPEIEPLPDET